MSATIHPATVTTNTGKRWVGFVICVDAEPLVAVDGRGNTLHGGGSETVVYGAAVSAPGGIYSVQDLAEDYLDAAAAKPLVGVTFRMSDHLGVPNAPEAP